MINRRQFLKSLGWGTLAFSTMGTMACTKRKPSPNFIFILVDDLGWKDLGCYGSTFHETPHLDRLAESGMLFTDAYAACPVCSPTRAAIMTGKHPARLNITDWIPGDDPRDRKLLGSQDRHQLPLEETTIAENMKQNGYRTFFAGKWHLGDQGFFPEDQGFDLNLGGHHRGSPPGGYYSPYENPKLPDGPEGEYLTDRLTDESIRFLKDNRDNPFFLFLSFYTVHTPIQACKRHEEHFLTKAGDLPETDIPQQVKEHDGWTKQRQDNPAYASMVHAMDENIGRLLAKVDELGLRDNTVIIFTSDNGGLSTLERRGYPTSNLPLRAGKGWCYEGGIRVPLIIRAPGTAQAGSRCSEPVTSMDYFPTILEIAGIKAEPDLHLDGLSLGPLFKGADRLQRPAIYWHYPHYHGSAWTPGAAVRAGDWKLIEFYDKEKTELYNLKDDLGEQHDLKEKMPKKTEELQKMLHLWQREIGAQLPQPNPNFSGQEADSRKF